MKSATAHTPRPARGRPRGLHVLVALLVASLLALSAPPRSTGAGSVPLILESASASMAASVLADHGATDIVQLEHFATALGRVAATRVDEVRADRRVRSVVTDRAVAPAASSHTPEGPATISAETVGATDLWEQGIDGHGVTVAVVDTGVAPHPAVRERIVAVLDVSGEDEGAAPDGHGHGTFMAGLVAGGGQDPTGTAPGAELVAVKVADREGSTSLAQVLAGLHAVSQFHDQLSIDVVLIALASEWPGQRDPLDAAVERLWAQGIVVVTAAGNEGPEPGTVISPGRNATVLTIGALDTAGTSSPFDDRVPSWSSAGLAGQSKPELVAPGTSVVSLRVPDSAIDRQFPEARVGEDRFRGSGSSMAAAVTAGAVALLLDADPTLTPDQVRARLVSTAAPAPADAPHTQVGAGVLDLAGTERTIEDGPVSTSTEPAATTSPAGPSSTDTAAWTWKAGTWKAWTWKAWTWKAWTWKTWTWR